MRVFEHPHKKDTSPSSAIKHKCLKRFLSGFSSTKLAWHRGFKYHHPHLIYLSACSLLEGNVGKVREHLSLDILSNTTHLPSSLSSATRTGLFPLLRWLLFPSRSRPAPAAPEATATKRVSAKFAELARAAGRVRGGVVGCHGARRRTKAKVPQANEPLLGRK